MAVITPKATPSAKKRTRVEWVNPVYVDGPLRGGNARVRKDKLSDGLNYLFTPEGSKRKARCHYYLYPIGVGTYLLTIGSVHIDPSNIDMNSLYDLILNQMAKDAITGTRVLVPEK